MKQTKPEMFYAISQNDEKSEADVYIFGDITSWPMIENDVSAYRLTNRLAEIPQNVKITVHINSYGGEVAEGLAIYNALKTRDVTTICDGFAASAASVIFCAGKERIMNAASLLFVHNALVFGASGNAADLEKQAADLRVMTGAIKAAYREAGVTLTDKALDALLDAETWITPVDAVDMGFATSVMDSQEDTTAQNSVLASIQARLTAVNEITPTKPAGTLEAICERLEGISASLWEGLTSLEDYHKGINAGDEPAEDIPDKGFFTLKTPTTNAATPKQED